MQIVVVGLDNQFVAEFSKMLAKKLNIKYVDF